MRRLDVLASLSYKALFLMRIGRPCAGTDYRVFYTLAFFSGGPTRSKYSQLPLKHRWPFDIVRRNMNHQYSLLIQIL